MVDADYHGRVEAGVRRDLGWDPHLAEGWDPAKGRFGYVREDRAVPVGVRLAGLVRRMDDLAWALRDQRHAARDGGAAASDPAVTALTEQIGRVVEVRDRAARELAVVRRRGGRR